jgi:hypothetical protein
MRKVILFNAYPPQILHQTKSGVIFGRVIKGSTLLFLTRSVNPRAFAGNSATVRARFSSRRSLEVLSLELARLDRRVACCLSCARLVSLPWLIFRPLVLFEKTRLIGGAR